MTNKQDEKRRGHFADGQRGADGDRHRQLHRHPQRHERFDGVSENRKSGYDRHPTAGERCRQALRRQEGHGDPDRRDAGAPPIAGEDPPQLAGAVDARVRLRSCGSSPSTQKSCQWRPGAASISRRAPANRRAQCEPVERGNDDAVPAAWMKRPPPM